MISKYLLKQNLTINPMSVRKFASKIGRSGINIPPQILEMTTRKLHRTQHHPISILSNMVKGYFANNQISDISIKGEKFLFENDFDPYVDTKQ